MQMKPGTLLKINVLCFLIHSHCSHELVKVLTVGQRFTLVLNVSLAFMVRNF